MSSEHEAEKLPDQKSRSSSEDLAEKSEPETPDVESADEKDVAPEPAIEYPTGFQFFTVIAALLLNVFLVALDQTIVATAIPKITDEFKGLDQVGWYASAYFMTFGGFQSTWGKIFKYFPLKITFLTSIILFEVGSLICGVAPNADTLIAGRAIAGLGAAGIATGAYVIVAFAVEPKSRATYNGMMAAMYGVSAIAGPLLGGAFSDKVTWRWCFYINLPIGGLVGGLILIFFRTPSAAKPAEATLKEKVIQMDLVGAALVMGALISFILGMQYGGQTKSWSSSVVIGLLVGSPLMWIAFVAWELYMGDRAMIPWRLLKQRSVWVGGLFQFLLGGSYFIVLYYLPIYFQSVDGTSPIGSGVRNLPMIIPVVIASMVGGIFITKTGRVAIVAVFGSVLATICAGLLYSMDVHTSTGKWIGYQIIGGTGWGIAWMCSMVIVQAYSKPEDISTSTAINLFLQLLGGALGVAAAQSAFVNKMSKTLRRTAPGINPMQVIVTGATQIRSSFPPEAVPGIVEAYMQGIKVAFILVIAFMSLSVLVSLMLDFRPLPANREGKDVVIAA
ncbi:uncharacterized protein PV09_06142 [Verruconis gallopava]|uniref:Major facilitator superfamily (MFS) profile domain-containing protein n=1 Tax=Verruconis gallopava TaxID=253628 RepID=A0A0D2AU80_9PEZI|nr:uncharacterized protein PV09_06142 [Verruconis gallopava]KIW02704.1 hypothetical protein PV09_06142 [Verruconis gallopava]